MEPSLVSSLRNENSSGVRGLECRLLAVRYTVPSAGGQDVALLVFVDRPLLVRLAACGVSPKTFASFLDLRTRSWREGGWRLVVLSERLVLGVATEIFGDEDRVVKFGFGLVGTGGLVVGGWGSVMSGKVGEEGEPRSINETRSELLSK
jgi:hypothetical protein